MRRIWVCKIGGPYTKILPSGSDSPMRIAVREAYIKLTGEEPEFCFSGWGGSLDENERAVVEDRMPTTTTTTATSKNDRLNEAFNEKYWEWPDFPKHTGCCDGWNGPVSDPDHCVDSCRKTKEYLLERLRRLSALREAEMAVVEAAKKGKCRNDSDGVMSALLEALAAESVAGKGEK